jgi:thiamine-phosphate pyrophosphorylase
MKSLSEATLYGILDLGYVEPEKLTDTAQKMIDGGIDILQLRAKGIEPDDLVPLAKQVRAIAKKADVPFVINDHAELAATLKADGLHLGQKDMPVGKARGIVGPKVFIGRSTHSRNQALDAVASGADYIGFGPIFATPTKPKYKPIGLDDIAWVNETVHLPVFCIGGIKAENLRSLLRKGARHIAVVSAILKAKDPAKYTQKLKNILPGD